MNLKQGINYLCSLASKHVSNVRKNNELIMTVDTDEGFTIEAVPNYDELCCEFFSLFDIDEDIIDMIKKVRPKRIWKVGDRVFFAIKATVNTTVQKAYNVTYKERLRKKFEELHFMEIIYTEEESDERKQLPAKRQT